MGQKPIREDINGLRAMAVLAVLIFHFSREILSGGFVGVDVFFVISGFLMTSIIFRGLEKNNFSLISFLKSRAKRIIPALLFVVSILLIIGYIFFEPFTYQLIGMHSASSLAFISNYVYQNESGYFDLDAYSKFLLHTWSLSVEWQFYIIYPIILLILRKFLSINTLKIIIFLATISFFICCILTTYSHPVSAYFMLYARAWEMLIGGLAFLYPLSILKNHCFKLEALGLGLIAISFFIISDQTPWPGYMALLPVLGTYLCILANNPKSILSGYILQKIGLWSYSIYLIHWPILVFFKKMDLALPFKWYFLGVIIASFIMYELIEKRRNYKYGLIIYFVVGMHCSLYIDKNGVNFRVDDKYALTATEYHKQYYGGSGIPQTSNISKTNINQNQKIDFIITGDSYMRQYINYFKKERITALTVLKDGCISTRKYHTMADNKRNEYHDYFCHNQYDNLIELLQENPNTSLVYSLHWDGSKYFVSKTNGKIIDYEIQIMLEELDDLIKNNNNRNYFLIGQPQGSKTSIFECKAKNSLPIYTIFPQNCPIYEPLANINVNNQLQKWSLKYKNVYFINPNNALCNNTECLIQTQQGDPIYSDNYHLSIYGAEIVGKYILDFINQVEQNKSQH